MDERKGNERWSLRWKMIDELRLGGWGVGVSDGITTRTVEVICANIRTMKMILKGRPHKVS